MDKKKIKKILYIAACVICIGVIIWLVGDWIFNFSQYKPDYNVPIDTEVYKFKEDKNTLVEAEISVLKESLGSMQVLITEEYNFTQVEEYTKEKTFLSFITTKSEFIFSYDGVVTVGLDCSKIEIDKDDNSKKLTITIPKSEIQDTVIDNDSFKLYKEKEGFCDKLTMEDYNKSVLLLKKNAEARAVNMGILDKADENAKTIISSFVREMLGDSEYTVEYVLK